MKSFLGLLLLIILSPLLIPALIAVRRAEL